MLPWSKLLTNEPLKARTWRVFQFRLTAFKIENTMHISRHELKGKLKPTAGLINLIYFEALTETCSASATFPIKFKQWNQSSGSCSKTCMFNLDKDRHIQTQWRIFNASLLNKARLDDDETSTKNNKGVFLFISSDIHEIDYFPGTVVRVYIVGWLYVD